MISQLLARITSLKDAQGVQDLLDNIRNPVINRWDWQRMSDFGFAWCIIIRADILALCNCNTIENWLLKYALNIKLTDHAVWQ